MSDVQCWRSLGVLAVVFVRDCHVDVYCLFSSSDSHRMASDSEEGFESADDELAASQKNVSQHQASAKKLHTQISSKEEKPKNKPVEKHTTAEKENDGWENDWDDFDVDDTPKESKKEIYTNKCPIPNDNSVENDDQGDWGDFGNWGEEDSKNNKFSDKVSSDLQEHSEREYKELADRLSSLGEQNNGASSTWGGWGNWGVTSLLTTGVSQLTSHVSQGLASVTQVLETGIGAPDPETLVQNQKLEREKQSPVDNNSKSKIENLNLVEDCNNKKPSDDSKNVESNNVFKLGKLVSNMTKLVETTGSAVVTGGLDTLEEIGKRTIRVLQGEEDGKKRLSTILKEARDRFEESTPESEPQEISSKKVHPKFEALFDDFQGLVHLEALEMLSKQCEMKLQTLLNTYEGKELTEFKETLDQVKEICELPDEDDEEKDDANAQLTSEILHNKLKEAIKEMGIQIQFDPLITCWEKIITDTKCSEKINEEEMSSEDVLLEKAENIMYDAIKNLAESSALSVQLLHRASALLSVRERRSTADEADGLTQLTSVLSSHIGEIAALYSQKLNEIYKVCKSQEKVNTFITNVFLEAGKGSSYIQDAFLLTIPILQVGAT